MFMGGLALGAAVVRVVSSRRDRHGSPSRTLGGVLVAGLGLLGATVAVAIERGALPGLAGAATSLLVCGFLVSALFAYASLQPGTDQRAAVSPLYASDLLGGAIGSLVASLLLVPGAGLDGSSLIAAGAAILFGLLLI
jgi:hypothetical protein